jgi:hypothetical protein
MICKFTLIKSRTMSYQYTVYNNKNNNSVDILQKRMYTFRIKTLPLIITYIFNEYGVKFQLIKIPPQ